MVYLKKPSQDFRKIFCLISSESLASLKNVINLIFRIASLYNVIMAPNISTADMIISNTLVEMELPVQRPNMQKYVKRAI